MNLPPSKRQRRIILSDDDEPAIKTRRAPPRLASGPTPAISHSTLFNQPGTPKKVKAKVTAKGSPKSSPEKANKRGKTEAKESKSLHTFFRIATEEQRWARKEKTPPEVVGDGEAEDAIEDDFLDEAFAELAECDGDENKDLDRRRVVTSTLRNGVSKVVTTAIGSSQKFAKPTKQVKKDAKAIDGRDDYDVLHRPWAERFAPISLEESAVHKKKVTDVQAWLSGVLQGRDRRVCDP
jgi:cell cycle checkpoint protein